MLGIGELLVVVSIGVLALGWRRIPQIGGSVRKTLLNFRNGLQGQDDATRSREVKEYSDDKKLPPDED